MKKEKLRETTFERSYHEYIVLYYPTIMGTRKGSICWGKGESLPTEEIMCRPRYRLSQSSQVDMAYEETV